MKEQILCVLYSSNIPKEYSLENQKKVLELVLQILDINQKVIVKGLGILEKYSSGCPILDRGLRLVRDGLEPDYIEMILLNTAISNNTDLLTALVVMEGVYAIQTVQSPHITRELLKAYFTFEFEKEFDSGINKSNIKLNDVQSLNAEEIAQLVNPTLPT